MRKMALLFLTACNSTSEPDAASPTYYEDVAPIIQANCVACHSAGGVAPSPLTTYEEVRLEGRDIAYHTVRREMPPFLPDNSGACNTYADARYLTDGQIGTIGRWVEGGMPEGDPANAPPPYQRPAGLEGITHSLPMLESYTPDNSLTDDYRCFVLDPGLDADAYLTASDLRPGNPSIVHHMVLFAMPTLADDREAERLDNAAAGPGYPCFGDSGVDTGSGIPTSMVAAWAPGAPPVRYPDGTGVRLLAGRKLVMQLHYNTEHGAGSDLTTLDAVLANSVEREGYVTMVGDFSLDIPPGAASHVESDTIGLGDLPFAIEVHMVFPHMHKLGTSLRLDILRGGQELCMTDVPRWDFHWQGFHTFSAPVTLGPSDSLRIACTYDSRGATTTTHFGEGTNDEMCLVGVYVTR